MRVPDWHTLCLSLGDGDMPNVNPNFFSLVTFR